MTVDAVIIGSGPGGATAADVLTAAGWTVTIIEKGRNHLLDPDDPTRPAFDYSNDEIKFLKRHFLGPDPLIEPRTFRSLPPDGDHPRGRGQLGAPTVGGGGTHADGKVPRFRPTTSALSVFGPQPDADVADWPSTTTSSSPSTPRWSGPSGWREPMGANPFAAPRSGPFPMPPGAPCSAPPCPARRPSGSAMHPYPAPTAANSVPYDGRPACNNCGFCAYFGCPIHAKGDPVAMLLPGHGQRPGRAAGRDVRLPYPHRRGRATGVEVVGPDGVDPSGPATWWWPPAPSRPRVCCCCPGLDHP
jgi:choline dehydrogenase-like flavoprotein